MMRVIFIVALLFAFVFPEANASDGKYIYTIDLTQVEEDRVMVELKTPKTSKNEVKFYLPKMVPGTYKIASYGRYAGDFKAYDKKGDELEVERLDENTWLIKKAKKLERVTYWVEDTYDSEVEGPQIYPMAGTNIEDKKNFVLNTPGYFGFFEGSEKKELELNVIRPSKFYGSTGLILQDSKRLDDSKINLEGLESSEDHMVDVFELKDYHHLIDSPLMYCEPDTTIIRVSNTEVLISVYSPKGMVKSDYIGETVSTLLMAQKEFLGGELPVEKYAFLFYFEDPTRLAPVQGALEHSYSSFYYFPEIPQERLKSHIIDVAAHEFFHIVTPLNIHSEEIEFFDFNNPKMSKHLWLYEGMTEYFSDLVQVKYDLISREEYLNKMREKMINASILYNDSLSFTDLSKYTIDKYPDQYNNVYEKGALIGMCLDIKLRSLSNGEYGVQDLVKELSARYGKSTPFKDEELFDVIEELTYPEIRAFIEEYIVEGAELPYEEVMEAVGVNYVASDFYEASSFGFSQETMGIDIENQRLYIKNAEKLDSFGQKLGFQEGDILVKINGAEIPGFAGMQAFLDAEREKVIEGNEFSYTVLRGEEEVELNAIVELVIRPVRHVMAFSESPTKAQLDLRESWFEPKN